MVGRQHFWRVSKLRLVENNADAVALLLGLVLHSIPPLVVVVGSAKEDGFRCTVWNAALLPRDPRSDREIQRNFM